MQLEYGGQRISVASGDCIVGSDAGAALRLTGENVLPRHAIIRSGGGLLVIQPGTPTASVRVNGSPIGGDPTPLFHGDRIRIGSHEIIVTDPARAGATRAMNAAPSSSPAVPTPSRPAPPGERTGRLVCLNDGREYQIATVPFVFGRDATAQVVIGSNDASRRHAEIVSLPDGDVLVDLSINGTFVNGERIDGRRPLAAFDIIRIGTEEFRYYPKPAPVSAPAPAAAAPAAPPAGAEFRLGDTLIGIPSFRTPITPVPAAKPLATLRVKSGASKGERFAVRTTVVNIGRGDFNDIRIPDPSVSSSHAKLQLKEGVWTLIDLGSTNGTLVDGIAVEEDEPLSPGATVTLGDVSLSFEPHDEKPAGPIRTAVLETVVKPVAVEPPVPPPAPVPGPSAPVEPRASGPMAADRPGGPVTPPRVTRPVLTPPTDAPPRRTNVILLSVAIVVLLAALAILVLFV